MDSHNSRNRKLRLKLKSVLVFWSLLSVGDCYNLDVDHSLHFTGPNGSLFGYSVLLHKHLQKTWLIAGAPIADSVYNPSIKKPGAVYKCNILDKNCEQLQVEVSKCGKTCAPENDNQWLGVSLSRQSSIGHVLVCGHRWKNVYYARRENQHKLPHGVCYRFESDLVQSTQLIPCYRDHDRKFGEHYGSCQAGISNVLLEDLVIMGAPGTSYWTGSVLVYNTSSNVLAAYVDNDGDNRVPHGSYLGYAVSAGHFTNPHSTEIVGGAPQHGQTGKAFIFRVDGNTLQIVNEASGKLLGSYFGASVCAVDLNADGLSDLLVGAPMFSRVREEGRVHVYINQGAANMKEADFELAGSDSYAARFGETIADLGDIDNDGYPDVAVGAPQEDELLGAIYIYNGRKTGITRTFSQRISGAVLGNSLKMFGQSVSGGVDVDSNGYPDVAVGAFLSDSAVALRTRPVVRVEASLLLPQSVNRSLPTCVEKGQPVVCLNITVCFRVRGRPIPGLIELRYNLTADVHHRPSFPGRFYFLGNGASNVTMGRVRSRYDQLTCSVRQAFMRGDVRDIFSPIHFEVQYELVDHKVSRAPASAFPPLKPILQQAEGYSNLVQNQTSFARHCTKENCSTDLQVFAHLVLPQSHNNVPYFALGNGKTIMLNATLVNAGDDAFLPTMHLRFPDSLHSIKVLEGEESHVSCEIAEESNGLVGLDCSLGNLYLSALSKVNVSFLLDVNQNSSAGNVSISLNATRENLENDDLLHDNSVSLTLPLRYGVDLNVHGFVSPSSFEFGDQESMPVDCYPEKFNYTFKVLNSGPSKALNTKVEISIPQTLAPYPHRFLRVFDLQSTLGHCVPKNYTMPSNDCEGVPESSFFAELFFFLSKSSKRKMFCSREDNSCLNIECNLGTVDIGKEVTVNIDVELDPAVLKITPGRHAVMLMESIVSVVSPKRDADTVLLRDDMVATVMLEAYHSQKHNEAVSTFIIVGSLVIGLLILALLVLGLREVGFFKRNLKAKRDSWDYVCKGESVS